MLANVVCAEQVSFNKKRSIQNDEIIYQFTYQWLGHDKNQQSLIFQLPQQSIFNRYRNFRVYKSEVAQKEVSISLRKHFKKNPISGVQITFYKNNNNFSANIKSPDTLKINTTYQKIAELEEEFTKNYLKKKKQYTNIYIYILLRK